MRMRRLALVGAFVLTFLGLLAAAGWLVVNAMTTKTDESVAARLSALELKLDAELAAVKNAPPQQVVVKVQTELAAPPVQVEVTPTAQPAPVSLYQDPFDPELQRVRRDLSEKVGVKVNGEFLKPDVLTKLQLEKGRILPTLAPVKGTWESILPVGYRLIATRICSGMPLPGEERHFSYSSLTGGRDIVEGEKLSPEKAIGRKVEFLLGDFLSPEGQGWEFYQESELFLEGFLFIETPKGEIREAVLPRRFILTGGELAQADKTTMWVIPNFMTLAGDIPSRALLGQSAKVQERLTNRGVMVGGKALSRTSRSILYDSSLLLSVAKVEFADERMPLGIQTWSGFEDDRDLTGFRLRKVFFFRVGVKLAHGVEIFAAPDGASSVDVPFREMRADFPEIGALSFWDLPDGTLFPVFADLRPVKVVPKADDQ